MHTLHVCYTYCTCLITNVDTRHKLAYSMLKYTYTFLCVVLTHSPTNHSHTATYPCFLRRHKRVPLLPDSRITLRFELFLVLLASPLHPLPQFHSVPLVEGCSWERATSHQKKEAVKECKGHMSGMPLIAKLTRTNTDPTFTYK